MDNILCTVSKSDVHFRDIKLNEREDILSTFCGCGDDVYHDRLIPVKINMLSKKQIIEMWEANIDSGLEIHESGIPKLVEFMNKMNICLRMKDRFFDIKLKYDVDDSLVTTLRRKPLSKDSKLLVNNFIYYDIDGNEFRLSREYSGYSAHTESARPYLIEVVDREKFELLFDQFMKDIEG